MIKKLWPYTRGYRKYVFLGALCAGSEAVVEMIMPLIMAAIVDTGIKNADVAYIIRFGILMLVMAVISMLLGIGAAFLAARAGQGFGAQLRQAQYDRIQTFTFRNIEKFSFGTCEHSFYSPFPEEIT